MQQNQQEQPQQPQDPFANYDDDDVVTVADMKKVLQQQQAPSGQQQAPQQQGQPQQATGQLDARELQMQTQYSDYQQEIQKIPTILQQNPHLESAIRNSENPFMTAYSLAKQFTGAQSGQQQQPGQGNSQQAQQVMDNLNKPQSVSQAGGGGVISKANYYAQLDDDKLEAAIARAKRG